MQAQTATQGLARSSPLSSLFFPSFLFLTRMPSPLLRPTPPISLLHSLLSIYFLAESPAAQAHMKGLVTHPSVSLIPSDSHSLFHKRVDAAALANSAPRAFAFLPLTWPCRPLCVVNLLCFTQSPPPHPTQSAPSTPFHQPSPLSPMADNVARSFSPPACPLLSIRSKRARE